MGERMPGWEEGPAWHLAPVLILLNLLKSSSKTSLLVPKYVPLTLHYFYNTQTMCPQIPLLKACSDSVMRVEPSSGISALWKTMRMKCLLFEPWYTGTAPQTKTLTYGNVGNQVTQERRGKCLLGVTLVSVMEKEPLPTSSICFFIATQTLWPAQS